MIIYLIQLIFSKNEKAFHHSLKCLFLLFFVFLVSNEHVFAQQGETQRPVVPVVIESTEAKGDVEVGFVTAEKAVPDLSALDVLRNELLTQQKIEQKERDNDGWFKSANKRFTPESITFFIAIGAVTFNSIWLKSHGDPLAMEKHILSLKDPIAHLSFYAFMQANGFYIDFRGRGLDPQTRMQKMRRFSYEGMAVGSLASSIVADLGHSVKMCTDKWISGKVDEQTITNCNEAWKLWTVRDKFSQYFPQIISMWISQAATEFIDRSARKGFEKVSLLSMSKKVLKKEWLVKQAYKITGADVAITFSGGTWTIKTIRFINKLTQFTMFVGVDHFLSQFTYRPLNNLIRPLFFDFDALAINKQWNRLTQPTITDSDYEKLKSEVENFSKQSQLWREHLNSDVEADLSGWMEMTKKILNQVEYAYSYYKGFLSSLYRLAHITYKIKKGDLEKTALTNETLFPLRKLPLFGLKVEDSVKISGGFIEDLNLNRPFEIEQRQLEYLNAVMPKLRAKTVSLTGPARKKYDEILNQLSSKNVLEISDGLRKINKILDLEPGDAENNFTKYKSSKLFEYLVEVRDLLGDPEPASLPFQGFNSAFHANRPLQTMAKDADFRLWSMRKSYKFSKSSDLMLFNLICGPEAGELEKLQILGVNFLSPQFSSPSLLKNGEYKNLCLQISSSASLYKASHNGKSLQEIVVENLNYAAFGDYRKNMTLSNFDDWWIKHSKTNIASDFKKYDTDFKELIQINEDNFFKTNSVSYKHIVNKLNQSKYLQSTMHAQFNFEIEFYLQLIQRLITGSNTDEGVTQNYSLDNFLSQIVESSKSEIFTSQSTTLNLNTAKVSKNFKLFLKMIGDRGSIFEDFLGVSKTNDRLINEILVDAGIQRKTEIPKDEVLQELESGSEQDNSFKYEPLPLKDLTAKQKVILESVRGLRMVEGELKKFSRMKFMVSQGLDLDAKEFLSSFSGSSAGPGLKQGGVNPRGN